MLKSKRSTLTLKRCAALFCAIPLVAIGVSAQGLDTKASPADWEEINFEFNSSVLVDGFPSLLRLSELLQKNPGYKVKLEGHTDRIGGDNYNDKLGMARASMVRDFLVKYGSRPSQIEVTTRGKVDPKYPGQKPVYTKTDEARWMNRRVVVTVMDDQGRTVSAAGVGEAIRALEPPRAGGMTDCCTEVLRRLDKLDDIAKMLRDLADQNADLRRQLDALKQAQQVLESRNNQPAAPAPAAVAGPTADQIADAIAKREPKFQALGLNVGQDSRGSTTASAKGRFFGAFADHYAFQAQGEYIYTREDKEGQIDLGLVDRMGRFQAGVFSSFKYISLQGNQNGGTLGQAAVTLDYIFPWGKVGIYGTYAFMNTAIINSEAAVLSNGVVSPDVFTQRYLKVVNQGGGSASFGLWGNNYAEANAGYLRSEIYGSRFGGTLRVIFPLNDKIAFTLEAGLNPTILGAKNDERATVGVQFGNALRPKEFMASAHPVPVDVPRVRYEVLTRNVRIGHTPPVADAGPDQIGVPAGPITLNGSGSYSPDGLPITFQWVQQGGPPISLSSPTSKITSFPAIAATTYIFQLTVTDSLGATGTARVRVSTAANQAVQILFFNANPTTIASGQSSTLSWNVLGATNVTISGIGQVALSGSNPVAPTQTTQYTLTATNSTDSKSATATVTVTGSTTQITFCYASPATIIVGESTTLNWQTVNATSVNISGVGSEAANGSVVVTPTANTTYTFTATGPNGVSSTCSAGVTVTTGDKPQIIQFSAAPMTIAAGAQSTLFWVVQNATTVSISNGVGNVSLGGSQVVSPTATTTWVLTATNPAGSVTASTTVNVGGGGPQITSFTATPNPSPAPGTNVVLACTATNATSVTLNGTTTNGLSATATVAPQSTTNYTCTATGNGQTASQTLTVTVNGGTGGNQPPIINVAGGLTQTVYNRFLNLDASASSSPSGNLPLTYLWESINGSALVINASQAVTQVQLGTIMGSYVFRLTVTDSKGNSSTAIVTLNLSY
jgi:hypothetical protein